MKTAAALQDYNFNIPAADKSVALNVTSVAVSTIICGEAHQRKTKIKRKISSNIAERLVYKKVANYIKWKERNLINEDMVMPGHRRLQFNELADSLAKLARNHGVTEVYEYTPT